MCKMMKIGIFVNTPDLREDDRLKELLTQLEAASVSIYDVNPDSGLQPETDIVLSVGGDGTFLSATTQVADTGVPILGVNLGRIGFLSENRPENVLQALLEGTYSLEDRAMLRAEIMDGDKPVDMGLWPYALNEVSVCRVGSAVLGISVSVDGEKLPTYWADGLLVATASGSTAYSLSVGGPICRPDARVLIISPIAPHNLNIRPLVVPDTCKVCISVDSRDGKAMMSVDNRNLELDLSWRLEVSVAQFSLRRIRLEKSNFVKALTSKLFWGEDIRNK